MEVKKKYYIFDIQTGKYEDEPTDEIEFSEYLQILEAERRIASRMIKQKLDKISPDEYKESTD